MNELIDIILDNLDIVLLISGILIFLILKEYLKDYLWNRRRKNRRDYYRNIYLKSDAWRRKRYVVLKRDNWRCEYCGKRATQVHHTRYAKYNIGKEPIDWLESVCKSCHDSLHD